MELDKDLAARQEARLLCRQGQKAQQVLCRMDQNQLDTITRAVARAFEKAARELAEHLTELGLDCGTLEYGSTTNPTYQTVLTANNWDICLGQTQLSANMDLSGFFAPWGSLYMNGITNADIQALNLMALENSGNYYNLHQKVAEYGSVIPVLFGNYAVYAHRGTLTSLPPSRDNVFCYSLGKTTEGVKLDTIYE